MTSHQEAIQAAVKAWYDGEPGKPYAEQEDADCFVHAMRVYCEARGLVMVPREATGGLLDIVWELSGHSAKDKHREYLRIEAQYKAMITAAPDPFKGDE